MRNIQPFNGFAPMQDIERLLNKMFPKNSALVLILLHARKLDGRFYLSGGSWSVLWPGSTIPAVFPKTMKCLSVLHKLFAPLLLSALYSSGFSLLVQLLTSDQGVRLDYYMAEERDINGWKVEDCYILERMRDAAAISHYYRTEQDDGTICYFFDDTCIRVRESGDNGKIRLEPVSGDQTACGEWVELPIDRVYGYCTLLERHLNKMGG